MRFGRKKIYSCLFHWSIHDNVPQIFHLIFLLHFLHVLPLDIICKTLHQYNKEPIYSEDIKKLQEIVSDYSKVKNYVCQQYEGVDGLSKLYPGYTVQNRMIDSGFRSQPELLRTFLSCCLRDIKTQWAKTKAEVLK